jgi:hypothetical protein
MFLLSFHVLANRGDTGFAHGESAVSLLPREFCQAELVVNPSRRIALEGTQHVRDGVCGLQSEKQMHMVGGTAYFERGTSQATHHAAKVSVDPGANSRIDGWHAAFVLKMTW